MDVGSAVELVGTKELSPVPRSLDADHGFLSLLLGSCMMPRPANITTRCRPRIGWKRSVPDC